MNRVLATLIVTTVVALGLSACSGAPAPEPKPVSDVQPTAPTVGDQIPSAVDPATVQACLDLAGPFANASAAMLQIAGDGGVQPQGVVDMWSALVDALDAVAGSASSPAVRDAAVVARDDFAALRDAMQRVYVDGDFSAMGDYVTASQSIEQSYSALLALCGPAS